MNFLKNIRLCSEITGQTKNKRVEKKMNGSNKKMNGSNKKMNGSNKKMNGSINSHDLRKRNARIIGIVFVYSFIDIFESFLVGFYIFLLFRFNFLYYFII